MCRNKPKLLLCGHLLAKTTDETYHKSTILMCGKISGNKLNPSLFGVFFVFASVSETPVVFAMSRRSLRRSNLGKYCAAISAGIETELFKIASGVNILQVASLGASTRLAMTRTHLPILAKTRFFAFP